MIPIVGKVFDVLCGTVAERELRVIKRKLVMSEDNQKKCPKSDWPKLICRY